MTQTLRWILGGVAALLVIGGGVYGYTVLLPSQNTLNNQQATSTEQGAVDLPLPIEDLVKRSAMEMINPTSTQTLVDRNAITVAATTTQDFFCLESASPSYSCFEKYFTALTKEKGVAAAFTELKDRYNKNTYVQAMCHPFSHAIGHAAADLYGDVGIAYTHGDSFCWSGYYHGVMEEIVGKITKENLGKTINNICAKVPGKAQYSFDYYNCVHGLGHGVMVLTENELFESLKLCDGLDGSWERTSCYSGVFMENVMIDNRNHFTKYLKPEDPLYPCNAVEDPYKSSCYLMQTSYMLKVNGGDFSDAFAQCRKADAAYTATCYQSVGRDASGRSSSSILQTRSSCMLGKDIEQQSNCVIGAVKDFISYFHADTQARAFCDSFEVQALKDICHSTATSYYKTL